jgi:outer membrane receptor protein involved in Fe transport
MHRLLVISALIASAFVPRTSWAQADAARASDEPESNAETTDSNAGSANTDAAPSNFVETVDRDVVDPRAPTGFVTDVDLRAVSIAGEDLGDALDRVPGVFVLRQSSYGQSAFASVRGGNPRQLTVSLGGVELTIPAGLGFDVGSTSPFGLQRARVFRGAAGVHRGAGALTGSVELMTGLPERAGNELTFSSLAGSFGTTANGLSGTIVADWAALQVGAESRRSEGDFTFEDGAREVERINNDHERQVAFANARIDISSHDRLETSFRYEQGERGTPGPSEFQDALSGARARDQQGVAAIRADHRAAIELWRYGTIDFYEALGAQWRRERFTNDTTVLGDGEFDADSNYVATSAKFGLLHFVDFDDFELANVFRFDGEFRHEDYDARERGVFRSDIDTFRNTRSLSVSNELLAFKELSVVVGTRHESLDGERSESAWVPFAGVSWSMLPELELRGNVARTYRPPDFDELYLSSEILRGDPDLVSERATTADVGLRTTLEDLRAEVVAFANAIDDPIRFLPVSVYVTQAQNLSDYVALGAEASAVYTPHHRAMLRAAYTFTRAQLTEVGAQAPGVPEHTGEVGARLELAGWVPAVDRLQIGGDARLRSAINLDVFGNVRAPAWIDLGAHVLITPVDWLDVRVSAENLLDRRDVTDVLQQPLPGRAFYLGLRLHTEQP